MAKPLKLGTSEKIALSQDHFRVVTLGRFVFLWDLQIRSKIFRCHPVSNPSYACFSPDGQHIAVKNTSGRIVIIDSENGQNVVDYKNDIDGEGSNLKYSASGEYIINGTWSGRICVRRAESGQIDFEQDFSGERIRRIHCNVDGNQWLVEHSPRCRQSENFPRPAYFSIWEWPLKRDGFLVLNIRIQNLYSSAMTPDGTRLAVIRGGKSPKLEIYRVSDCKLLVSTPVIIGGTGSELCWSPNGSLIGSVQEKRIVIYRGIDLMPTAKFTSLPYPSDVAFSPETNLLILGDWQAGLAVPMEDSFDTPKT